jgi:hypothetical protein
METNLPDTYQKALTVNLDSSKYGSIAEIGAGQETARWFFRVGGAAGTIAKAMSAYDMQFSDSIYGPCKRYVSRERLEAMLEHEYNLIIERLDATRGAETTFFAFANTVTVHSYTHADEGHGWLGIRFQTRPREAASQIVLHVRLLGQDTAQDQETLGVLGVNLIYGAQHLYSDPRELLETLLDNLSIDSLEIDLLDFSGPAFEGVDNRLMALLLVQQGASNAAMFTADGKVVQPGDMLYKKAVLIERSRFRPPTKLTMNLLDSAHAEFSREPEVCDECTLVISEMTLNNLSDGSDIQIEDFLQRADILCMLGKNVLISNYGEFYRLASYLHHYTDKPVGVAMGVPTLKEILDERYYTDLSGGILEAFGRLFKNKLRFYVCPCKDPETSELITADELQVAPHLRHLYEYLLENRLIKSLTSINQDYLDFISSDILEKIRCGDASWETMVPEEVGEMIRERALFDCRKQS